MKRRRKTKWSYNAGERGRNWVRAYCKGCERACSRSEHHTGGLYLEWREETVDPVTGARRVRRPCVLLKGVVDAVEAKRRADDLAARFATTAPQPDPALTIAQLLDRYIREATPQKGESKQEHDRRARRVWIAFLDSREEPERRSGRLPETLDRRDWEHFIEARRNGRIPGWERKVRNKIVLDDLSFLVTVLNWGVGANLLARNPWDGAVRRAQGWPRVKELNPHRPGMPEWVREGLVKHSTSWQFRAALVLERETRRRNSAVRRLLWSDIDVENATVRWCAETDKSGRANVTPLTVTALTLLRTLPSRGIGDVPVFPTARDPSKSSSRHAFQQWLKRAKRAWLRSIDDATERERVRRALHGVGFHSEKRAGVRDPEFRKLPAAIQEEIAGTNYTTLRRIYDEVTAEDIREAWAEARQVAK